MSRLTSSLLIAVFLATLGMGWALDGLFARFGAQSENDDLAPYRTMGRTLVTALDQEDRVSDVASPDVTKTAVDAEAMEIATISLAEFQLPAELRQAFLQGEPLALESEQDLNLNFYMPNTHRVLTLSLAPLNADEEVLPLRLLFTLFFYGGILLLILLWLYPLVNRLEKLRDAAKSFGQGELKSRVSNRARVSYISDIENEFDRMASRIETLVNDNKLLGSAVSHDLRTPLARFRFGLDVLTESKQDDEIRQKYLTRLSHDVDEMEALVETLLDYARLDQSMVKIEKKPLNISALVSHCASQYTETLTNESAKTLELKTPSKIVWVKGDEKYLSMLLNNLLRNAEQHAKSRLRVSLEESRQTVSIRVEDDGDGIPLSEREKVLQPFERGSHSTKTNGYGMGLAITKRIAEWHDGSLAVGQSQQLGGAALMVVLPGQSEKTLR